jgi:predicted GNAT family acetyltransferase
MEDDVVFASFRMVSGCLLITHVKAPRHLRGTGEAARLMEEIADHARQMDQPIKPLCSYALLWFRRYSAYADLLA